ncbi:MAG: hypothetical protein HY276_04905 [Ignavibacteriales bacterium]|nr:hypothetical protein [Ignavibacteriales bacterium]
MKTPRVFPFTTSQGSIGAYQRTAPFYYESYYFAFYLTVNIGDSSSCLDLRPATGPPRFPQPIVASADTHLTAFFFRDIHQPVRDSLWFTTQHDSIRDSLFLDSTLAWRSTIFDLGNVKAGDSINFFLKSVIKGTKGETMYPRVTFQPYDPPNSSPFDDWEISFENWIDSHFGDYKGYLFRNPARYKISFEKESASPGDTIRFHVEVLGVPDETTIESMMDVNIVKGREYTVIQDTLGRVFGQDRDEIIPDQGIVYPPFSQINNQLAIVVADSAPPGEKIIVQVVSEWDWIYGGRAELNVGKDILLGETKYYQAKRSKRWWQNRL